MLAGLGAGASERSNEQSTIIKSKRQGARTTATPRARRRRSDRTRRHKSRRAPRPRGAGAGAAAYRTGSTGRCASSPRTPPFVCLDEAGAVSGSGCGRAEKRTARGRTRGLRGVRWDSEKVSRRVVARAYVYVQLQLQPPPPSRPPSTPHMEDGDSAYGGGGTDVTRDGDAVTRSIAAGVYRDGVSVSAWPSPWAGLGTGGAERSGGSLGPDGQDRLRLSHCCPGVLAFGLACITVYRCGRGSRAGKCVSGSVVAATVGAFHAFRVSICFSLSAQGCGSYEDFGSLGQSPVQMVRFHSYGFYRQTRSVPIKR